MLGMLGGLSVLVGGNRLFLDRDYLLGFCLLFFSAALPILGGGLKPYPDQYPERVLRRLLCPAPEIILSAANFLSCILVILTCLRAICSSFQQDFWVLFGFLFPVLQSGSCFWALSFGSYFIVALHGNHRSHWIFCPVLENSCLIYLVWLSTRDVITKEVTSSQVGEQTFPT